MPDPGGMLKGAWASVKNVFAEVPAKGPCIPCAAKKAAAGPSWEKAAGDVFPGKQSYNNCGVQAARQVVEQAKGKLNKTEQQFLDDAIASCNVTADPSNPTLSGGTNSLKRQCIMQQYGVPSSIKDATMSEVEAALRDGKGVIITADAKELWAMQGISNPPGLHAVLITNGIYDSAGKLTGVDINDTGIGQRYALSTQELNDAMNTGSGLMNVTDNRIWPTH